MSEDAHAASGPAGERADEPVAARIGGDGGGQRARDRRDRAIEREFAEHREIGQRVGGDRADGRHHGERDGQVVMAALLGHVGGSEVDGDFLGRQRQARGVERGAHPLARFGDRLVGEADDGEPDIAARNLHLDVDGFRLDPLERHRRDAHHHQPAPWKRLKPSSCRNVTQEH